MKRTADESFDTPSPIALPSPPDEAQSPAAAPSPSPSSVAGPSRKRSRTDASPEERKEARAHRNRIAAQNSRDRRKAQFSLLEQRVSELEEENRQLRAGMGLAELRHSDAHSVEQRERDHAREKENEELRERIKTLESGWEAVMKALAATGLPLNFPPPPPAFSSTTPSSSDSPSSPHPPTNSFPVMVPPPILPISPATSPSSSSMSDFDDFETTCHSAAGGLATNQLQLELSPSTLSALSTATSSQFPEASSAVDEAVMQDLFREILAPSPSTTTAPLPLVTPQTTSPTSMGPAVTLEAETVDWDSELEMQRLLDLLPVLAQPGAQIEIDSTAAVDFPSAQDLEMNWDLSALIQQHSHSLPIAAF